MMATPEIRAIARLLAERFLDGKLPQLTDDAVAEDLVSIQVAPSSLHHIWNDMMVELSRAVTSRSRGLDR